MKPGIARRRETALWLVIAAITLAGTLLRAGPGTWAWRANTGAAGMVAGVPMEWEWIDVAQSAWFFEGNHRWMDREWGQMMGQNLIRFVPGVLVSLAGVWTGGAWSGALALTWLCWLAACGATARLYLAVCGAEARAGAAVSALLTAASPGFSAFAGNIDAHQFGYAAAPWALLALHSWLPASALIMFLANATLELGPPLVIMLWLHHVPRRTLWSADPGHRRREIVAALRFTTVFAGLQIAWWSLAFIGARGSVVSYNEGLALVAAKVRDGGLDTAPLDLAQRTAIAVTDAFGPLALAFGMIGLLTLPARGRWWALTWLLTIIAGAIATRGHARVFYVAFPAVYVAAAAGIEAVARVVGNAVRLPRWAAITVKYGVASAAIALSLRLAFGDVGGDLSLVHAWWQ